MSLPKYVHGRQEDLPKTLASRVSYLRNERQLHIAELSLQARVSIELLEDIESGIETWLPTSVRQRIARVLKIDPIVLEEVERKKYAGAEKENLPPELLERIQDEILNGATEINCPVCGKQMKTWIQEGFDFNGEQVKSAKGHCMTCVFQLRQ